MTTSTILSDNGATSGSAGLKTTGGNDGTLVIQTTTAGGTATTAMTLGTDQSVTFAQAANLPNTFGFKNRLINGSMIVDQRNAGASKSVSVATVTYCLDRWSVYCVGAGVTVQQVASGVTGIPYVQQVTGAASVTGVSMTQKIEAKNIADLAGSSVTISFLASSSQLTSMTLSPYYANSADNFASVTAIGSPVTFTINSTLTQYTTTIALPSGAANGVELDFAVGALTSGTWKITNVQLEKGSIATSFDYRSYGTEFDLCRRYYEQINGFVASANSSSRIATNISYYPKRAAPTLGLTGVIQITSYGVGSSTQSSAVINSNGIYPDAAYIDMPNFSGLIIGGVWYNYITNSKAITLSSEL